MTTSFQSQTAASTLPPEVLDRILDFYFARDKYSADLALVCRAWRGPVQSHWFRSYHHLNSYLLNKLWEAVASPSHVGEYIRSLGLNVNGEKREGNATLQQISQLLARLPCLTSFDVCLEAEDMKGFPDLPPLPSLQKLVLYCDKFEQDLISFRQLLVASPNITSLLLWNACMWDSIPLNDDLRRRHPVDLPHLTELSLVSTQFCKLFDTCHLLSERTLLQITKLELSMEGEGVGLQHHSPLPLLAIVGKNIRSLTLEGGRVSKYERIDTKILQACPNLEILTFMRQLDLGFIAPTLTKMHYRCRNDADFLWLLQTCEDRSIGMIQRATDWVNVTSFEIEITEWSIQAPRPDLRTWRPTGWKDIECNFARLRVNLSLNGLLSPVPHFD